MPRLAHLSHSRSDSRQRFIAARGAGRQLLRVLELRQYTLHPGQRDTLIELFEREFIESQESHSMHLVGLFRDLDAPDRFVWLRGFADMPTRRASAAGLLWRPGLEGDTAAPPTPP